VEGHSEYMLDSMKLEELGLETLRHSFNPKIAIEFINTIVLYRSYFEPSLAPGQDTVWVRIFAAGLILRAAGVRHGLAMVLYG